MILRKITANGQTFHKQDEISKAIETFYKNLYTKQPNLKPVENDDNTLFADLPQLNEEDKSMLSQAIKFYNKGCEKLSGETFSGKMLLTWLVQVQDKANMFTWTPILTIKGKLLTQHYTEITMDDVRAHAQVYQDRASRQAQNAEMLIQCLKASISRAVYNKVYLQRERYTIYRRNTNEPVQDGVCFLKTIIDNYHSNTRSMTKQIRKQLASLNLYMRNVAKGDVKKQF